MKISFRITVAGEDTSHGELKQRNRGTDEQMNGELKKIQIAQALVIQTYLRYFI